MLRGTSTTKNSRGMDCFYLLLFFTPFISFIGLFFASNADKSIERWEGEHIVMTQEEKSCVKEMTIEIFQMMQAGGGGGGGGGSLFATGPAGPKGSVTGEEFRQAQRLAVEQCTPLREFQYGNITPDDLVAKRGKTGKWREAGPLKEYYTSECSSGCR